MKYINKVVMALLALTLTVTSHAACVTAGSPIAGYPEIRIDDPISRILWLDENGSSAGFIFTFNANSGTVPAASGTILRQVGLKLYARDDCNVLYVMWPAAGGLPGVSIKHNPTMIRSRHCKAGGYKRLYPEKASFLPALEPGSRHWLEADHTDGVLTVRADGKVVWVGPVTVPFVGNPGFRSDNVDINLRWLGSPKDIGQSNHVCVQEIQ